MTEYLKAESGLQLMSRLSSRPDISFIDTELFSHGSLKSLDIIELRGGVGSGKTILATHLIAKCILSREFGGVGARAILINTDHHFQIKTLVAMLEKFLRIGRCKSLQKELKASLEQLIILSCFDSSQFKITLHRLPKLLAAPSQISLLVCDSPLSFYWMDNFPVEKGMSNQKYLFQVLSDILKSEVVQQPVTLIFTVSDMLISPTFNPPFRDISSTHHKVFLKMQSHSAKNADSKGNNKSPTIFEATVSNSNNLSYTVCFVVTSSGIEWLKNRN